MTLKLCRRVLCQLPFRNTADAAGTGKPFVTEPAGRPAVSGVRDQKHLVAMGCNSGLIAENVDGLDAMQHTPAGWPELDLIN